MGPGPPKGPLQPPSLQMAVGRGGGMVEGCLPIWGDILSPQAKQTSPVPCVQGPDWKAVRPPGLGPL